MNIRTAKDILGFPNNAKIEKQRNRTHPKHNQRYRFVVRPSRTPGKKPKNYYEHRTQLIQAPKTPILSSMEEQLREWEEGFSQARQKKSQHSFANPITQRKVPFNQSRFTHYNSKENNKKSTETVNWPKLSHTQHLIKPQRQEVEKQAEVIMESGRHVLRRSIAKGGTNESHTSKQIVMPPKDDRYYISDIKSSVREYINNRQYVNPYLSHIMDSISVFQANLHLPVPKYPPKTFELPPPKDKLTLVFDLDETLLHTQVVNERGYDNSESQGSFVEISTENGQYYVNLKFRPHASQVLHRLREKFELGVFTAGQQQYGRAVLNVLDPESKLFSFRLFRHHCFDVESRLGHVKDLRVLKNRDLSKVVLIDNSPQAYLFQKNNAIPIIPFFNDQTDKQLLKLQIFLNDLQSVTDVRPALQNYFKLDQYHIYTNMLRLIKQLY